MLIDQIPSNVVLIFIKIIAIAFLVLHLIFSVVLFRQTLMMSQTVEGQASKVIITLASIHLLFSVFVFLWTIFIL